ncbi:MAG TPA: EamA family transporter [Gemmatimonadaceae bacterium]|nr:EamA family transporter [Gemmatimonadaceae bacterium]
MTKQTLAAVAFATLAAILWAATLGTASLLPVGFPTVEVVAGRYIVQLVLLTVVVMPFRGTAMVRTTQPKLHILRGLTMFVMPMTFEFAVHRLGATNAFAALWLGPLFGLAFGRFIGGEPVPRGTVLLVAIATVGALVAHSPAALTSVSGALAIVCAAASFGAFLAFTRALRGESAATGLFWTAICVAIPSTMLLPFVWEPVTLRAAAALVLMGGLWLLVLLSIDEALRRAPLRFLAPFLLSEIIWARLLFRAPWTRGAIAGTIVLLVCAAWVLAELSNSERPLAPLRASAIL